MKRSEDIRNSFDKKKVVDSKWKSGVIVASSMLIIGLIIIKIYWSSNSGDFYLPIKDSVDSNSISEDNNKMHDEFPQKIEAHDNSSKRIDTIIRVVDKPEMPRKKPDDTNDKIQSNNNVKGNQINVGSINNKSNPTIIGRDQYNNSKDTFK